MGNFNAFRRVVNGSKQFTFEGSVLVLTDYYTGERTKIDLALIDEDVFNEIVVDDEDMEDEYYED